MVVEIKGEPSTAEGEAEFHRFEDRLILIRAGDAGEAQEKAGAFAADYQKTSPWQVRKVVDIYEVLDTSLGDGVEVYSAFIDEEWAKSLMRGGASPVGEWQAQNPGKPSEDATVGEVLDAWEDRSRES